MSIKNQINAIYDQISTENVQKRWKKKKNKTSTLGSPINSKEDKNNHIKSSKTPKHKDKEMILKTPGKKKEKEKKKIAYEEMTDQKLTFQLQLWKEKDNNFKVLSKLLSQLNYYRYHQNGSVR